MDIACGQARSAAAARSRHRRLAGPDATAEDAGRPTAYAPPAKDNRGRPDNRVLTDRRTTPDRIRCRRERPHRRDAGTHARQRRHDARALRRNPARPSPPGNLHPGRRRQGSWHPGRTRRRSSHRHNSCRSYPCSAVARRVAWPRPGRSGLESPCPGRSARGWALAGTPAGPELGLLGSERDGSAGRMAAAGSSALGRIVGAAADSSAAAGNSAAAAADSSAAAAGADRSAGAGRDLGSLGRCSFAAGRSGSGRTARHSGSHSPIRRGFYALPCIGAKVRLGRFRRLRLRLRSSRDRLIGGHLRKNRPTAGSENRALSRHWLARSAWSRSHKGILAPMSCVCVRGPGLIALGADAPKTVGEIGLKLKGGTDVVPVPLIVHGHGTSPEPSPPPRLSLNASRALP